MTTKTATDSITVPRSALADTLDRVALAVPRGNNPLPVLGSVRLAPVDGGIEWTATSLDVTVRSILRTEEVPSFEPYLLPCARLQAIVAQLPTGAVTIARTKAGARLSIDRARFDLVSLPAGEFPTPDEPGGKPLGALPGPAFTAAMKRTATHLAAGERATARPILSGVHVVDTEHGLELAATDGYRLAREHIAAVARLLGLDVIVPSLAVGPTVRLFAGCDAVEVRTEGNHVAFSGDLGGDPVTLVARTLEGPFPALEPVFGQDLPHTARVDRAALTAAIKRVSALMTADRVHLAKIRLAWHADHVVVGIVGDPELGSGEDVVACAYTGPDNFKICFQPTYLLDALAIRQTDEVDVGLKAAERAASFRAAGAPRPQGIVMPIRDLGD